MEDGTSTTPRHTGEPRPAEVQDRDTCRLRDLLDRIGDKWSLLVVELLGDGTKRFTELKRDIEGISQRMLTLTLRRLERDGLVDRTVHPVVPPRVDYGLTSGGQLLEAIQPIVIWTRINRPEIIESRQRYDDSTRQGSTAR